MIEPRVYFIPKNARRLVITYLADDIAVSIIIPNHQKEIYSSFVTDAGNTIQSKMSVDVPELCLTHLLREDQFLLNAHHKGLLAPYVFANVYDYGAICFGDFFDHCPQDLRQAWNYYWETPFNQENSEYYDYHQNRCLGVSQHSLAGHKNESHCICACCIEICNCPCFCVQSQLFEQYLKSYSSQKFKYIEDPVILRSDSLFLDVVSQHLIILPRALAATLGLKDQKYPDIFFFVLREDETSYHCAVDHVTLQIPKAWITNGTPTNTQTVSPK
jgi:hypothetical protein